MLKRTEDSKTVLLELGEVFTLTKFISCLIRISKRVYPKLVEVDNEEDM